MRSLALLLLALLLPSCTSTPSGLSSEQAVDAYRAALLNADADRALALLEELAGAGDLSALSELADARRRGYLKVPYADSAKGAGNLPIGPNPFAAALTARRLERALRDSARVGSETALFLLADRQWDLVSYDGEQMAPSAARDSFRALYHLLDAAEADPFRLAFLARGLGDEAAFDRLLRAAATAGDPQACVMAFYHLGGHPGYGAEAVARTIDHYEGCRERAPEHERAVDLSTYATRTVGTLGREARAGNAHARVMLDSLHALGVFERHPELAVTGTGS